VKNNLSSSVWLVVTTLKMLNVLWWW